ncbi:maleylpyruvate isomerase N-terminal domain-containing protein, partial [Nocardia farcinica]|uniref:maleylpyruvate isomerase N-terminal domain-containing protein n=1 Tax=Nocardia farcinica TaxID=37329 RepID=UPI002457FFD8
MTRTFTDARRWMTAGTTLFADAVAGLTDADFDTPTHLPGWNRRHLVAHVAANADALRNLVRWAATGTPTPMYASPEERGGGGGPRRGPSPAAKSARGGRGAAAPGAAHRGRGAPKWGGAGGAG